ncbi:histidine phosphatase family protein [Natranaerobius thermophilus]|uniref:Phosphoglycerate mutase n=1 Tax=Natranaerobius thermophilus (strain ATCC BAA-1301 / DSM 18059 / JW/NM-WN-LF) TaxID=457570 RepID=B2A3L6_NATTJ|nr:histidine phosphatase family protein [Natranaerobius thermophilus]ACB86445.1 Phosphoglycerate mutase [Natranaerobius thermophilus JW/NM-WN-LF]
MRLLLIRHGESTGNFEERFQGKKEYQLTDRGCKQAQNLAEKLRNESFDAVYTSSLSRAHDTAKEICKYHSLDPIVDELLSEYCWGVIEGHTREEIKDKYPDLGMKLEEDFFATSIPEEEGMMNLKNRVSDFYDKIFSNYNGNLNRPNIAVVSHGRVLGGLVVYLTGYSFYHTPWPYTFSNASITEISYWYEYDKGRIVKMNDTSHLFN